MPKFKPNDIVLLTTKMTGKVVVAYRIMNHPPFVNDHGKTFYFVNGIRADGRNYGPLRVIAEDRMVLRKEV